MIDQKWTNLSKSTEDLKDLSELKRHGLLKEFFDFLRYNKKWWLAPIIMVLLVVGILVLLGGTVAAPFIYTLF